MASLFIASLKAKTELSTDSSSKKTVNTIHSGSKIFFSPVTLSFLTAYWESRV